MSRTIDSILNAHESANERRAAGKPIWDRTLQIKNLLSSDNSDSRARATGKNIARVLRTSHWFTIDQQDAEFSGERSAVAELADEFEKTSDLEDLEALLNDLYDLADADRVWIE